MLTQQRLDNFSARYIRQRLDLSISATLSIIILLPKNHFGLLSTKVSLLSDCPPQRVENARTHRISLEKDRHRYNIENDIHRNTKAALTIVKNQHEERLKNFSSGLGFPV